MSVRVEVVCVNPDGSEQRREVLTVEARELAMETLGLSLSEGKALLAGVQDTVVAQQVHEDLEQRRVCPHCQNQYTSKDSGRTLVSTVFGRVEVPNPRWNRCSCQTDGPKTFRPMRTWLEGQTSPEMLYLETKWASLIPFAKVAELLKEVLPVSDSENAETIRAHLQATPSGSRGSWATSGSSIYSTAQKRTGNYSLCRTVRSRLGLMADTCGPPTSRDGLR